jgi:hypothetical protein
MTGWSTASDASSDADLPADSSALERQGSEETTGALLPTTMGDDLGADGSP